MDKESKLLKEIANNPKAFYKHADKSRKAHTRIGPLKVAEQYVSDPKSMADILSKQYENVFSAPKEDLSHYKTKVIETAKLTDLVITKDDVINAIKEISNDSAPGPDGIPVVFYKDYAEELAYPLSLIWRQSIETGEQIEQPILAIITPIHKGGPLSNPANYRPIALTNHMNKIFERILRKQIVQHLEENGLINETQHGFRTGRSTITQLLNYYDSITTMLEDGNFVDAIYLDFAKAFDKVDHNILLCKLMILGIRGKIYSWIETFLKHRQQAVKVEGRLSDRVWVKSDQY